MTITKVTLGSGPMPASEPAPAPNGAPGRPAGGGHRWRQGVAITGAAMVFVGIVVGVGS